MKVLIVLNSSWQAYNFRFNLARALKLNGYDVVFLAPYDKKYSELLKQEFKFYNIDIDPKGINPIADIKTMFSMYRLFRSLNPSIVLNFTIKPNIYSSLVARIMNIKSISNISGLGTLFINKSIVTQIAKILYKIALNFNTKVFFQNNDDKLLFIEHKLIKKNKTDLLPGSGVDLNKFIPIINHNDGIFKFLVIARLLKDKGIMEFVDAIKIINKKYYNVEFQLLGAVGVANKTAISQSELDTWIKEGLLNYLGTTDSVQEIIAKCDCVVLPSYREGTPRSLLEACSMGKPIITTNVAGCKDVVDDGINGYLCKVKSAKDLAIKMEMMINLSNDQRKKMGQLGRDKIVTEFDEKIVINKYLASIKEVLYK